jgi:23S rRNA (cytosine1962-C5)-methyltransferase
VAGTEGGPADGAEVSVVAHDGRFVARGLYNQHSQIRVRLYAWTEGVVLDEGFWRLSVRAAVAVRRELGLLGRDEACRLVFSEADGLSGLTVDRYGAWLAVQFRSLALWQRRDTLLDALSDALLPEIPVEGMVLRTEKGVLDEEGLELSDGPLAGGEPEGPVTIHEHGLQMLVDLRTGQKTGAYLDQRDNRARAARYASGRRVADICCYTGGFTLPLLAAGAESVVAVDVSQRALDLAQQNLELNGMADGRVTLEPSDAFRWLEGEIEAGRSYGMVVLDPPRFARSARGVPQALKGYASLNELAMRCLEPGGVLVTCSCTGRVGTSQFVGAVATAARRSGRRVRILESHGQPPDHPVSPTCPETAYLNCLICRVD